MRRKQERGCHGRPKGLTCIHEGKWLTDVVRRVWGWVSHADDIPGTCDSAAGRTRYTNPITCLSIDSGQGRSIGTVGSGAGDGGRGE